MSRPKLRSPHQPLAWQLLLGLWEFAASLKLAVVLILTAAGVLAWGTFVESKYGLPGVHFGVYQSGWFAGLHVLLAVNIFSAAAIRFPWKRHQTGFVITHIGLLTLLAGCLLSHMGGIDAQMPVWERGANHLAYQDSQHLVFEVIPDVASSGQPPATPAGQVTRVSLPAAADSQHAAAGQSIGVRLEGGPFNWAEYDQENWLPFRFGSDESSEADAAGEGGWLRHLRLSRSSDKRFWFPWGLPFRGIPASDLEQLRQQGIDVQVLDYYSDSDDVDAPQIKVRLTSPQPGRPGSDGRMEKRPEAWGPPIELAVQQVREQPFSDRPFGTGASEAMGGGTLAFWMAGNAAETASFLDGQPDLPIGPEGQVVLHAGGQRFVIQPHEKPGQKLPLGDTGLEAEVAAVYATAALVRRPDKPGLWLEEAAEGDRAERPVAEVNIYRAGEPAGRLVLFADAPQFSQQDHQNQVFGDYWFDHGKLSTQELMAGMGTSRIDILQGVEEGELKLFYRYWNREKVVVARELPLGEPVDAFKMPIAQLRMRVDEHLSQPLPGKIIRPVPFNKETTVAAADRAAKLRVSVDGNTEEFWISGPAPDPLGRPPGELAERLVRGKGRTVRVTMPLDLLDIGFRVRLQKFERRLDPGTSQAAMFSSVVDFMHGQEEKEFRRDVLITMNAPVDFSAPTADGNRSRSYRIFQEAFNGPYKPGDGVLEQRFRGQDPRDWPEQLYMSILTINYDPGRGVKYAGCLLIVAGIATMFWMKAYFFKPKSQQ